MNAPVTDGIEPLTEAASEGALRRGQAAAGGEGWFEGNGTPAQSGG